MASDAGVHDSGWIRGSRGNDGRSVEQWMAGAARLGDEGEAHRG